MAGILIGSLVFAGSTIRMTQQCNDGIDNDGDGRIDYPNDIGCSDPGDDSEVNVVQCNDGIDNDNDGKIDYPADPGCLNLTDVSEINPDSCTDSDGGWSVYVQGTVSGSSGGNSYSYTDFCLDSINLNEYYCLGTTPNSYNYNCAGNSTNSTSSCFNGACV